MLIIYTQIRCFPAPPVDFLATVAKAESSVCNECCSGCVCSRCSAGGESGSVIMVAADLLFTRRGEAKGQQKGLGDHFNLSLPSISPSVLFVFIPSLPLLHISSSVYCSSNPTPHSLGCLNHIQQVGRRSPAERECLKVTDVWWTWWDQLLLKLSWEWDKVQELRHRVRIQPMIRHIKTAAHAWHYAWTCSDKWWFKGSVFPGAPCGKGRQPFNLWYLDMAIDHSMEKALYANHLCWIRVSWQITFQEIHVFIHTHKEVHGEMYTQVHSAHMCSQSPLMESPGCQINSVTFEVIYSLFHRATEVDEEPRYGCVETFDTWRVKGESESSIY